MIRFGIEHEVAFLGPDGAFADFSNTSFATFESMVAQLPEYSSDYPMLRIGDLGIKKKRWYVEGYERYGEDGAYLDTAPKGIEIRTTLHETIAGAVQELRESFAALRRVAEAAGFWPVWISLNPFQRAFEAWPPLNPWERARRASSPEKQTAEIPMLTYGPDLNFSDSSLGSDGVIDLGRKLTYYSPWIVPFSFSSPFYVGKLWQGYSMRTYLRTGARPAAMVFLADAGKLIKSQPSLTKPARIAAENGRVEFKACDAFADFSLYGSMLALIKGLARDTSLAGRSLAPDTEMHRIVAQTGFDDPGVEEGSRDVLAAADAALRGDPDAALLAPLGAMLNARRTPAHQLIDAYQRTGSILDALRGSYPAQPATG